MKNLNKLFASQLILVVLLFFGCKNSEQVFDPGTTLTHNLQRRFSSNQYVTNSTLVNPYDQVGKDARRLLVSIHATLVSKNVKFQKTGKLYNSKKSRFKFTSDDVDDKLGISDPAVLDIVASEISGSNQLDIERTDVTTINDKLNSFTFDENGIGALLNEAKENKRISELQYNLIKIELEEMETAKTFQDALAINATMEHEIMSSTIPENEKGVVLMLNSLIKNTVLAGQQIAQLSGANPNFQQVAVVVPYIIAVVIDAAIGFVGGWILGGWLCQNASNPDCQMDWAWTGAIIGVIGWVAPTADWVLEVL